MAITPEQNVYNHASQVLYGDHEDTGTVEGVLDVVSVHNGYEFCVSEVLYGKTIKCFVSESLLDKALRYFRKRVEVDGLIRYDKNGFPKSVEATNMVEFPSPEEIPHFSELKGILGQF